MNRYQIRQAGPNWYVRDSMTGETVMGSITKYEHEAIAFARRHNNAYNRFKAELPRPIVEPSNARS